jgi:hypothetical protein
MPMDADSFGAAGLADFSQSEKATNYSIPTLFVKSWTVLDHLWELSGALARPNE